MNEPDPDIQLLRTELGDLVERVDALNVGTYMLAGQVEVLGDALTTMNELKDSQQQTAEKVADVEQHSVNRQEALEMARRLAVERRRSLLRVWLAVVGVVVVVVVSIVLIVQGRSQARSTIQDQQNGCVRTQNRVQVEVVKERALALVTDNAKEAEIHTRAADALLRSLVDCTAVYKP